MHKGYSYLRIKKNPLSFVSSQDFERIIIIPNTEETMNLVLLLPRAGLHLEPAKMHSVIKQTLSVRKIKEFMCVCLCIGYLTAVGRNAAEV